MAKKSNIPTGYILIKRNGYHVRKKPATEPTESLGTVKRGDRITYLGKAVKGWYKVAFEDKVGYIYYQAGEVVSAELKELTVKGNWNVRSAPSSKADILGKVSSGDKILDQGEIQNKYRLVVFENQNAWLPVNAFVKE